MLDTRGPSSGMGGGPGYSAAVESSFKHYVDADGVGMGGGPPEVINVTSGGGTILPPDQVIDVSRAPSLATLNGAGATSVAGAGTLPRASTLSNRYENKHLYKCFSAYLLFLCCRSHHGGGGTLKRHSQFQVIFNSIG